jgi:hypothetical protein
MSALLMSRFLILEPRLSCGGDTPAVSAFHQTNIRAGSRRGERQGSSRSSMNIGVPFSALRDLPPVVDMPRFPGANEPCLVAKNPSALVRFLTSPSRSSGDQDPLLREKSFPVLRRRERFASPACLDSEAPVQMCGISHRRRNASLLPMTSVTPSR